MISPSKLAHVVWRTSQMDTMIDWYTKVLGARVVFQSPELSFLTYDDEHHRMAFIAEPGLSPAPAGTSGLDHVAFTYASLDDLLAVHTQLKEAEIEPHWAINHGPTTSLYYRDPDGNQVELQLDNYPDERDLNEWFRTGAFKANPIGVEFDPDELKAERDRGVPAGRLVHRKDTPQEFVEAHSGE